MGEIKEEVSIDEFPEFMDMKMINFVEIKYLLENRLEKLTEKEKDKEDDKKIVKKKLSNLRLRRGGNKIEDSEFEMIGTCNTFWKQDSSKNKKIAKEIRNKVNSL